MRKELTPERKEKIAWLEQKFTKEFMTVFQREFLAVYHYWPINAMTGFDWGTIGFNKIVRNALDAYGCEELIEYHKYITSDAAWDEDGGCAEYSVRGWDFVFALDRAVLKHKVLPFGRGSINENTTADELAEQMSLPATDFVKCMCGLWHLRSNTKYDSKLNKCDDCDKRLKYGKGGAK
jgi:hypothetical protein